MRSLDIAGTGMQAQQTNVEVISNNIANMTTTGFKRRRGEFQDLIYQNLRRVGSNSSDSGTIVPSGAQVGLGVRTAAIYRINEQGNLQQTSNTLDMAIQGNGYFQVTLPSGDTAYTRDGTFGLAPDGTIVTADGYTVQPGVQIPSNATAVTVNASGQVQVTLQGQTAPQTVGQLQLAVIPQRGGAGCAGRQPAAADRRLRPGGQRQSRLARVRQCDAGLRRDVQRQRCHRDHQPDHRAARLRDEQQGDHRQRRNDVHTDQPAVMIMTRLPLAVLALCLGGAHAEAATLRTMTTLHAPVVLLSDLFDDAGANAERCWGQARARAGASWWRRRS